MPIESINVDPTNIAVDAAGQVHITDPHVLNMLQNRAGLVPGAAPSPTAAISVGIVVGT